MPTLYQLDGSSVVRVIPLLEGVLTIGRGPRNDVVLNDSEVSRQHCRLMTTRGQTVIEDLQSRNGTWIAAQRLESPHVLSDGDQLQVGTTRFVLRYSAAYETATLPGVSPTSERSPAVARRFALEEYRFRFRWNLDWSGFAFGWRIRRA